MELKDKQEHVLRCIKLGMDFFSSAIVATCTSAETELLENDTDFQYRILEQQKIAEYELLRRFEQANRIAVKKGNAAPTQWKLGKINKNRWGDDKGIDSFNSRELPGTIVLVGKPPIKDNESEHDIELEDMIKDYV